MSRIATNWVWKINLKASQKLLLLALADRADEHHCCYPSIQRLSNDTGLDRKTICRQINQMIAEGLIIDTGERKGATKQVKVLRLNITEEEYQKRDDKQYQNGNSTEIGNDPKNGTLNSTKNGTLNSTKNGTLNSTKNGTLNSTKNGTLKDPKNGTLKDPKNGTQNLSVEPNIESKDLNTQNPIEKKPIKISRYAFEGEVIRLNQKDFEQWASIFSDIDLLQELKRFDVEFSKEKPKNWFSALSAKLNYQNETARKRKQQRQPVTNQSTITIAKNGLVFF